MRRGVQLSYQALYRVWRPQSFIDVVGQEHVTQTLQNALLQDKISHAYFFLVHVVQGKQVLQKF